VFDFRDFVSHNRYLFPRLTLAYVEYPPPQTWPQQRFFVSGDSPYPPLDAPLFFPGTLAPPKVFSAFFKLPLAHTRQTTKKPPLPRSHTDGTAFFFGPFI